MVKHGLSLERELAEVLATEVDATTMWF